MMCSGCGGPSSLVAGCFHWDDCPWVTKDHPDYEWIPRSNPPRIRIIENVTATRVPGTGSGYVFCHFCRVGAVYLWFEAAFRTSAVGAEVDLKGRIPCCRDCAGHYSFPSLQAQLDADAGVPR